MARISLAQTAALAQARLPGVDLLQPHQAFEPLEGEFDLPAQAVEGADRVGGHGVLRQGDPYVDKLQASYASHSVSNFIGDLDAMLP